MTCVLLFKKVDGFGFILGIRFYNLAPIIMKDSWLRWTMCIFVFLTMITTPKVMSRILIKLTASRFCSNWEIVNFDLSSLTFVNSVSVDSHTSTQRQTKAQGKLISELWLTVATKKTCQDKSHDHDLTQEM